LVTLFRPAAGDWFFTDLIHWPRAYQLLQTEQQRTETLDEINLRLRQRMRHKEHLITLLIEGECSLAQVTEEFWQTIQSNPGYLTVLRHHFPGSTDYEKTLANVLYHAQFQIRHLPPAQQAQVWQRLEAQRRQLARGEHAWHHRGTRYCHAVTKGERRYSRRRSAELRQQQPNGIPPFDFLTLSPSGFPELSQFSHVRGSFPLRRQPLP